MQQNQNPNKVAATEAPRGSSVCWWITITVFWRACPACSAAAASTLTAWTVSATNDPAVSRITVTLHGDDAAISQLILQTERLEVTRQVFELTPDKSLQRELLLLKVACNTAERAEMREIAAIYKSKIIDLSPDSMVFELTGARKRSRLPENVQRIRYPGTVPHRHYRAGARRQASPHAKAPAGSTRRSAAAARHPLPAGRRIKQLLRFNELAFGPQPFRNPRRRLKIDTFLFLQTIQTKQRRNYHGNQKVL